MIRVRRMAEREEQDDEVEIENAVSAGKVWCCTIRR